LKISSNTLHQIEKFRNLGIVLTSHAEGRKSRLINRLAKHLQYYVSFLSFHGHKTGAFNHRKAFKSVFGPIPPMVMNLG